MWRRESGRSAIATRLPITGAKPEIVAYLSARLGRTGLPAACALEGIEGRVRATDDHTAIFAGVEDGDPVTEPYGTSWRRKPGGLCA